MQNRLTKDAGAKGLSLTFCPRVCLYELDGLMGECQGKPPLRLACHVGRNNCTYALRTECERYNSRFKSTGQERLWVRNGNSAANLNTLAHISALAVALAAVLHGSHSYRSAKQLRRSA